MIVDVNADDFLTGIVAACRVKGFTTINMRDSQFYDRVSRAFEKLREVREVYDLDVRFAVFLDPLHNNSPVVEQAVSTAVQRKIVSFDNPEFVNMRIKLGQDDASRTLDRLPGGAALYRELAAEFVAENSPV